jgi:DHA3 family macrolide efflux protein-like MFS transporter
VAVPLVDGPMMAIMQSTVKADMQGRVFTLMGSLVALASPVGLVIAGPLSDLIDIRIWFLLAGLFCLLTGVILFFIPSVVQIEKFGNYGSEGETS